MVQIKKQKIIVDNKEVFLFGGELHYFRIPHTEWRHRVQKLKEAGANLVSTYIPWKFHEMEEGNIDLVGKTRPERNLAAFLEVVSEEGMYCLVRPGPYVMAEIVDHGVPTWFIDNYPEAVAKTDTGEKHPTRVVSYMHPTFLEKTERWYEAVCKIIRPFQATNGGPVVMFQLDNEVGMFHWVTNLADYNTETVTEFKRYLEEKYTIADFNDAYSMELDTIEEFFHPEIVKDEHNAHALHNDFSLFMRKHYRQFIEHLRCSAREKGIAVPFVVNIHGFHTTDLLKRGTMYPIGISQLLEAAKVKDVLVAGDYYIGNIEYDNYIDIVLANAFTKAIQWKEQPLFSAEFQGGSISDKPRLQPSTFDLTTRLCVADGMNAVNYYMFAGGVNYDNIGIHGKWHEWQAPLTSKGECRPHYYTIQHLGSMFGLFERPLLHTYPVVDTHVGFYPDYFMTEFHDDFTSKKVNEIQHSREAFLYNGIAKGLRHLNINFDAINLLDEEAISVKEYPVLWMFSTKWMDEKVQLKLVHYLTDGGKLVLFPTLPDKTMKNKRCTVLKDFVDVQVTDSFGPSFFATEKMDNISASFMEAYDVHEGVFAWNESNRAVVGFEKEVGRGKLIMFGVGMEVDFEHKKDIVNMLAQKVNTVPSVQLEADVDVAVRSGVKGEKFVFLHNFDEVDKETTVSFKGDKLFGGNAVQIPGKSGLMLPINVELPDDMKILYGTGEIYHHKVGDDSMSISVRVPGKEVTFMVESTSWIPQLSESVSVKEVTTGFYLIRIETFQLNETVIFKR